MHARIIALANQKGGVAKTTTTINLGVGLAQEGFEVLVADCDPQASLTTALGIRNPDKLTNTLSEALPSSRCSCSATTPASRKDWTWTSRETWPRA